MKRIVLTTALALGLAAPAFSSQLAAQAGVEPGVFSTSQLIQLRDALDEQEHARYDYLVEKFSGNVVATQSFGTSQGNAFLADVADVEAGSFTTGELIQLRDALNEQDHARYDYLVEKFSGEAVATQSFGPSQGKEMEARIAGVDANSASTGEIAARIDPRDVD